MNQKPHRISEPARLSSYFKMECLTLVVITISGVIYNAGMTAGPWFEGKLAQYLCDILGGTRKAGDMIVLAIFYLLTILGVQATRYVKRLYVRKFGNKINREMKKVLYHCLVHKKKQEFETESIGAIMTNAITYRVYGREKKAVKANAFTTFLSCFTKLATKASKSAKLFNAVQKADLPAVPAEKF